MLVSGVVLGFVVNRRCGFGLAGGGLGGILVAFTLMEFPRLALVFVGLGLLALCGWLVLLAVRAYKANRALQALVPAIESSDTGPRSAGRKIKRVLSADPATEKIVRRGIEYVKRKLRCSEEAEVQE